MLVPLAMASRVVICGCMSVGKPGCGSVFTLVLFNFALRRTKIESSYSSISQPVCSNLSVIASRCFGMTFLISTSPPAAAVMVM